MTLFRQIYALLFGLFLLTITSLAYIQITQTQRFLTKQMHSEINNASHSLGLMLTPVLEAGDNSAADTLVNVIFEGGYYQQIKLTWLVDGTQQLWVHPMQVNEVPQWFIDLGIFHTIKKETVITSGWLQLAKLEITAHPGLAYNELWQIISNTVILFAVLFLIAILLARLGLTWILRPLNQLSQHAEKIALRQFGPELPTPKTRELKHLVIAFNNMSTQLKQVFNSLDSEVSELRNKNLVDQVSNLPNRQYMVSRLTSWLSEPSSGALFLAKFGWLEEVHRKYGYQVRDETIRLLAEKLHHHLDDISPSVVTRIAAYEFAFIVGDQEHEQLTKYLQTLIRTVNQEVTKAGGKPNENFAIGIAERTPQSTVSEILSQADNALQRATMTHRVFTWFENNNKQIFSREQWRKHLTHAIENKQFHFKWQPVLLTTNNEICQREIYCQLHIEGNTVPAGQFMTYVELLSIGTILDRCLIESLNDKHIFDKNFEPVAINLTIESIASYDFHQWLKQFLRNHSHPERICFEIPETCVYNDLSACKHLCHIIRDCGAHFGIDHFGRQFGSMNYLQHLHPSYVKLDQSFAHIEDNYNNNELCRALVNVAKGLDIQVIVTGVQTKAVIEQFEKLRLDAYQGFIMPPVAIDEDNH
ncbi:EAL domain-containing protein [Shewanella intestini]|uniref:EAL domain-containing protein n=1 Tax=Shewanella intestini TaxID=2017544 RepID=A0ABS5I2E0_9GAMM|nr:MULTISPECIES: EAL domain-containing protein [Shewanella]MBR9728191.1 EAL domain-containing protein [Shewanella intestini]MRG36663.1 EAL domain-containing protein [Shewanella sp. XMDDZSB0408]